jgi:hypothetical protein
MQNEQLQFRLQSQPNLSVNNGDSFNLSNISIPNDNESMFCSRTQQIQEDYFEQTTHSAKMKRASTLNEADCLISGEQSLDVSNSETPIVVKLRSKSFKNQLTSKLSYDSASKKYSNSFQNSGNRQFRPVSEMFDFNLNERDFGLNSPNYMTRSVIMYDETQNTQSLNEAGERVGDKYGGLNSSSASHLDMHHNEDPMTKSVPCMVLKPSSKSKSIETSSSDAATNDNEKLNSLSSSSLSINEHSIIMLE